jgi:hypothetical protein
MIDCGAALAAALARDLTRVADVSAMLCALGHEEKKALSQEVFLEHVVVVACCCCLSGVLHCVGVISKNKSHDL